MKIATSCPLLALSAVLFIGQQAVAQAADTTAAPQDNSRQNQEPSNRTRTADDQKDNARDRNLTRDIRRSVTSDNSLSTYAHNVKIVAVDGTVTLNGVVRSEQEKMAVAAKAEAVAGKEHVVNEIKVQPDSN